MCRSSMPLNTSIRYEYTIYHLYERVVPHQSVVVSGIIRYWGNGDSGYNSCTSVYIIHTYARDGCAWVAWCNGNNTEQEQTDGHRHSYFFTDDKIAQQLNTQQTPKLKKENLSDKQNDCQTVISNTEYTGYTPSWLPQYNAGVKLASPSTDFNPCPQINSDSSQSSSSTSPNKEGQLFNHLRFSRGEIITIGRALRFLVP